MFESILKMALPHAKQYLGTVNSFIVEQLDAIPCKREEGEYAAYTILKNKTDDACITPCVYDKNDKMISHGTAQKVTDFLTQILEKYGSK